MTRAWRIPGFALRTACGMLIFVAIGTRLSLLEHQSRGSRIGVMPAPHPRSRPQGTCTQHAPHILRNTPRLVLNVDVLDCPNCGERRDVIASTLAPIVITKILSHLGIVQDVGGAAKHAGGISMLEAKSIR